MVALLEDQRTSLVLSVYERVLGNDRHQSAEKFVELFHQYEDKLPSKARSRDFVRNCVMFSFEIRDLVWHGQCDMKDPNWVSPGKIGKIVDGLLEAGFFLESDPHPRIAKESWLD